MKWDRQALSAVANASWRTSGASNARQAICALLALLSDYRALGNSISRIDFKEEQWQAKQVRFGQVH
jgi:hypothetical protein